MNKIDQVRPETTVTQAFKRFCEARSRDLVERINQAKEALLADFSRLYGAPSRILRLALSEAEALAWQTAYPHLVFPELAAEKARAAVEWERRQQALNRGGSSVAFAA